MVTLLVLSKEYVIALELIGGYALFFIIGFSLSKANSIIKS
jgi:hypothetical protein